MVDAADATDIQARPLQLHNVEVEVLASAIDSVTNERGRESDPRKVVDVQVDSGEFEVELSDGAVRLYPERLHPHIHLGDALALGDAIRDDDQIVRRDARLAQSRRISLGAKFVSRRS